MSLPLIPNLILHIQNNEIFLKFGNIQQEDVSCIYLKKADQSSCFSIKSKKCGQCIQRLTKNRPHDLFPVFRLS